jgi:hypothetical protein
MHPFVNLAVPAGAVAIHWFEQSSFALKNSAGKIALIDPYFPHDRPAGVTIYLRDGSSLSAQCLSARGGPDLPLPADTWRVKLGDLAQPAYPRIVSIMDEIVGGHAPRMNQSWRAIVQDITEDAT